jgi:CRISPR/Cas system-associated exonuclease Cas4 (RecB family)
VGSLEVLTGKNYVSHSAISTWLNCGWQYYLSRVHHVPEAPSYWLVGGKALHECTEKYDRGELQPYDPTAAFTAAWDENYALSDNGMPFRAGGRASKAYPNKEDKQWWLDHGPKMLDYWVQFRQDSGFQLYQLSGGDYAIETEINTEIKGVNIKAFLDRLMVSPNGELGVVDIKTSAKEPATNTQLGIYAILSEKVLGVRPTWGAYFLARSGELTTPVDLTNYTENRLGSWMKSFTLAVENKIFIPAPGFMCSTCAVNRACYVVNGEESYKYPELNLEESEINE